MAPLHQAPLQSEVVSREVEDGVVTRRGQSGNAVFLQTASSACESAGPPGGLTSDKTRVAERRASGRSPEPIASTASTVSVDTMPRMCRP